MRRTTDEGELIDFSPNFKNQTPGNVPGIEITAASFNFFALVLRQIKMHTFNQSCVVLILDIKHTRIYTHKHIYT